MSQQVRRKPWFHESSGYWCAQVNRRRHYLDRDPAVAQRKLNKLLQDQKRGDFVREQWLDAYFADLAHEFLEDVRARRALRTFEGYREMLQLALSHLGTQLKVGEISKLHLAKIEQAMHERYSPTTIYKTIHAVQRVINWAVECDLLETNPLLGYKKPRPRQRNRIISPEEFQMLLKGSSAPRKRKSFSNSFRKKNRGENKIPFRSQILRRSSSAFQFVPSQLVHAF